MLLRGISSGKCKKKRKSCTFNSKRRPRRWMMKILHSSHKLTGRDQASSAKAKQMCNHRWRACKSTWKESTRPRGSRKRSSSWRRRRSIRVRIGHHLSHSQLRPKSQPSAINIYRAHRLMISDMVSKAWRNTAAI